VIAAAAAAAIVFALRGMVQLHECLLYQHILISSLYKLIRYSSEDTAADWLEH